MTTLKNKKYRRLLAFGCSFSQYNWTTWPEIVAADLDIPMYNFAECGAGNQYIANTVAQAYRVYDITSDDLVMICWTGTLREDRWVGGWRLTGDITNNVEYSPDFLAKHVDPVGGLIRDLASICLVRELLSGTGCDYHMFSMIDIWRPEMEQSSLDTTYPAIYEKLLQIYQADLNFLKPSFEKVLWQGDIAKAKNAQLEQKWQNRFHDWHPLPFEQLDYMSQLFEDHQFSQTTIDAVSLCQKRLDQRISQYLEHHDTFDNAVLGATRYQSDIAKDLHLVDNNIDRSLFLLAL